MNDDTREKRWQDHLPRPLRRYALLAGLALVVVSLGVVLTPVRLPEPAEPPFSERARAAALSDTLRLRAAGEQLSPASAGTGRASVARTVSLLTSQAQALVAPGRDEAALPLNGLQPSAGTTAAAPATAPRPAPPPASEAALAAELAASANRRLADAAVADGGMARLLAAVGTAQLLQASSLSAAAGTPVPPPADPVVSLPSGACPGGSPTAPSRSLASGTGDGVDAALAAAVRTELATVYAYQVALPRLSGDAARAAADQLARHESLAGDAELLSRMNCTPAPPREPGYALSPEFLASPAEGLAGREAAALPVFGDLVALSEGQTRRWAIAGLAGSARRAALWGAETGPVPGLATDPADFPPLPAAGSTPSP